MSNRATRILCSLVMIGSWNRSGWAQVGPPDELRRPVLYSAESPFNRRIPVDAEVDPQSALLVRSLTQARNEQSFCLAVKEWTTPVYFADATTPRRDVLLTADWAPARRMKGVPIPPWAEPDPEDDGAMVIVDLVTRCEYDFWQAKNHGDRWTASWGNSLRLDGTGVFPKGLSARGSGFALLAGVIWPEELRAGRIDHALVFTYAYCKAGGPVPPATESDGEVRRADAIPEGARVQLDPALDLDRLALEPYERIIARCLQEYGMILGDSGGGIEIEAIHPKSARGNPYLGLLPDGVTVDLPHIPVDRMRVLKLPPQIPEPVLDLVPSGCTELEPTSGK